MKPFCRKFISAVLLVTFGLSIGVLPSGAQLPPAGRLLWLTPAFQPPVLRGMTVHPENPLLFDFIVDRGQDQIDNDLLKKESTKLIKYFLASMTIPDKDAWVNLSPYEKDRIIPDALGQTEMGRQMLEQDYVLKQLSSSLTNPDKELGQKFWNEVKSRAQKQFGTTDIPLNTFNKVWIVPAGATVVEKDGFAYITESKLKVMLDEDYVALANQKAKAESFAPAKDVGRLSSEVFRELILPQLVKEVNEGKNFIQTRQVYQSVILAAWYKKALKDSLLGRIYADKSKIEGVESDDKDTKQKVYDQYLEAFKKGVYNVIKEDENNGEVIPRKYFSGGQVMNMASSSLVIDHSRQGFTNATRAVLNDSRLKLIRAAGTESLQEASAASSGVTKTTVASSPTATVSDQLVYGRWESIQDEYFLYHGTSINSVDQIRRSGLTDDEKPFDMADIKEYERLHLKALGREVPLKSKEGVVHVTTKPGTAISFARGGSEVLRMMLERIPQILQTQKLDESESTNLLRIRDKYADYLTRHQDYLKTHPPYVLKIKGSALTKSNVTAFKSKEDFLRQFRSAEEKARAGGISLSVQEFVELLLLGMNDVRVENVSVDEILFPDAAAKDETSTASSALADEQIAAATTGFIEEVRAKYSPQQLSFAEETTIGFIYGAILRLFNNEFPKNQWARNVESIIKNPALLTDISFTGYDFFGDLTQRAIDVAQPLNPSAAFEGEQPMEILLGFFNPDARSPLTRVLWTSLDQNIKALAASSAVSQIVNSDGKTAPQLFAETGFSQPAANKKRLLGVLKSEYDNPRVEPDQRKVNWEEKYNAMSMDDFMAEFPTFIKSQVFYQEIFKKNIDVITQKGLAGFWDIISTQKYPAHYYNLSAMIDDFIGSSVSLALPGENIYENVPESRENFRQAKAWLREAFIRLGLTEDVVHAMRFRIDRVSETMVEFESMKIEESLPPEPLVSIILPKIIRAMVPLRENSRVSKSALASLFVDPTIDQQQLARVVQELEITEDPKDQEYYQLGRKFQKILTPALRSLRQIAKADAKLNSAASSGVEKAAQSQRSPGGAVNINYQLEQTTQSIEREVRQSGVEQAFITFVKKLEGDQQTLTLNDFSITLDQAQGVGLYLRGKLAEFAILYSAQALSDAERVAGVQTDFKFILSQVAKNLSASSGLATNDPVGGIDFDSSKLDLQIKRDGHGVPLPLPQQNLDNININGLYPVIINIMPVNARTLPILSQLDVQSDAALSKS